MTLLDKGLPRPTCVIISTRLPHQKSSRVTVLDFLCLHNQAANRYTYQ